MTQHPVIFIDGEAGTTGLGIRERLSALPVTLHSIDHARRKDPAARKEAMAAADVVVLCLPDAASREAVKMADTLGENAPRILDASTAFRTAPGWVYGFPELSAAQAAAITGAPRVSNPGCYPTGAIALLRPLIDAGILDARYPVCINAVSGYSGGGRTMIEAHERDGGPAFELYGLGLEHKHVPEIHLHAGLERRPVFVPSVGHFPRGMIVSIPLHLDDLNGGVTGEDLHTALATRYAGQANVHVLPHDATLSAEALAGSDKMELRVHASTHNRQAVLTARLDNLGKGASGAALQNIALMLGL
ncbi:N-acetyl-gamma-glutamyl-phosphate reductase [Acetobacter tropicalis]|uniref:N-acetyl-gamma-glutamyl-phosphate reductase n=1 Tax=Acetobacter tropicalis TaxID=104102 RepID=A0A094Z142_9PROT|nr:N-acetyl-gamma-glutamyl-phosphate reductase [Acetobacter tropicalis]KAA8390958.1 N-acetyl-gamma-glutamyl-phosphate reductase [Acetobacter tropicalis]KAA8392608.1 N-acetyl-gamma-glutamyl-phosphate reductase [Acetobacter tropicalis]KGB26654.1 N-acetyl-gamma-glutamyl-phosphate reductase [Acetobacter tropicalis]MBC9009216.1 N-acetyl-gamma-glutamyl-phosphate reductase [Acetobacter tropicalis]MDO8171892.1 N-acetyl-gamma-glutamyl-phosphate reductase [Acetobacter tropicalis]